MGRSKKLERLYFVPSHPAAYRGLRALKNASGLDAKTVQDWLSYQDAYTLHKRVVKRFPRRKTIVSGIDAQWQCDLIDVRAIKKDNDGYVYLLTCIDVFSKRAWVVPLKDKRGSTLVSALEGILKKTKEEEGKERKPRALQTDKGSEFVNAIFQKYLRDNDIHFFVSQNEEIKASVVERFNRTLKEKLWRYFTHFNTLTYTDALDDLVDAYNRSYHSSIGARPVDVNVHNQERVWQTLYGGPTTTTKKEREENKSGKLKIGDKVRLSKARRAFKKGYLPSWTEELFTVTEALPTTPSTYRIRDWADEKVEGTFYKQELQRVGEPETYRIESVLKTKRDHRGNTKYLVKWWGYPPSFNTWIDERDILKER